MEKKERKVTWLLQQRSKSYSPHIAHALIFHFSLFTLISFSLLLLYNQFLSAFVTLLVYLKKYLYHH